MSEHEIKKSEERARRTWDEFVVDMCGYNLKPVIRCAPHRRKSGLRVRLSDWWKKIKEKIKNNA